MSSRRIDDSSGIRNVTRHAACGPRSRGFLVMLRVACGLQAEENHANGIDGSNGTLFNPPVSQDWGTVRLLSKSCPMCISFDIHTTYRCCSCTIPPDPLMQPSWRGGKSRIACCNSYEARPPPSSLVRATGRSSAQPYEAHADGRERSQLPTCSVRYV